MKHDGGDALPGVIWRIIITFWYYPSISRDIIVNVDNHIKRINLHREVLEKQNEAFWLIS